MHSTRRSGSRRRFEGDGVTPIPAFDLREQHRMLADDLRAALERVFKSGRFILDEEVAALEREVAAFVGVREAVACGSGTDALHLALRAAGVGAGDEVVTSAFSFIATAEAVLYAGAVPVFADVDPASFTLDPAGVESALSPKTRAIVAVHLYGHPADVAALSSLAEKHGLALIEDCAQAFGARHGSARGERYAGTTSFAGCHSFFPTKNLGACGDGGMVTTDDAGAARRLRLLRNHGNLGGYRHEIVGYNSRLDELQAAILRVKLKHVERFNRKRRELAAFYTDALRGRVQTPACAAGCEHAFNQYTVLSERRDEIAAALDDAQIGNRIYYPIPLTEQPSLRGACRSVDCRQAERVARQCLSLPMFPELAVQDAERVAAVVIEALDRPRR